VFPVGHGEAYRSYLESNDLTNEELGRVYRGISRGQFKQNPEGMKVAVVPLEIGAGQFPETDLELSLRGITFGSQLLQSSQTKME
jgi:hypothetical protein